MPKVKVKRKSTFIDMTAMSDVTVLLLTFFMLTSTFIKKEPVQVSTPSSVSDIKIPEVGLLTVLIEPSGKVFLSPTLDCKSGEVLKKVGEDYNITFSDQEVKSFSLLQSFGIPISGVKDFLAMSGEKRDEVLKNLGIPSDTIDNQFKHWIKYYREINGTGMKLAIKADAMTPYPIVSGVLNSLLDLRENRYNLITSLKTGADAEEAHAN